MQAHALDEPVVWRDPDTGCGYLLTQQGGASIRYQRDGRVDCPSAAREETTSRGALDNTAREMARGLDSLKRELERLRDRPDAPR